MSSDGLALLDLWERAHGLSDSERALALAASVAPAVEPAKLADQPLGDRDLRLVEFHRRHAGPTLEATAQCPACEASVELAVDSELLVEVHRHAQPVEPVRVDDRVVTWRPLTSNDVLAASALAKEPGADQTGADQTGDDEAGVADLLVAMCIGEDGADEEIRAAVAEAVAASDPLAEILIDTACAECDTPFVAEVDISRHAMAAFERASRKLISEVDALGRRYGWTEAEILAVPPQRRKKYLALAEERPR